MNDSQIAYHKMIHDEWTSMIGVAEVTGPKDHPWVVLSHQLTSIASKTKPGTSIDEIPWCSSGQNLINLQVNFKINPVATIAQLKRKKIPDGLIRQVQDYAGVTDDQIKDTGTKIPEPTWSAAAISWDKWGVEIALKDWRKGVLAVLTRDGGNHVAAIEGVKSKSLILLGGNQSNMICSSDSYGLSRLISVRVAML